MAVDVDFAGNVPIRTNGYNNVGLRFERAGELARVGRDILDDEGVALGDPPRPHTSFVTGSATCSLAHYGMVRAKERKESLTSSV